MASLDSLLIRASAAVKAVRRIVDDTPVVLRIKHVGTGTTQAATVVISNTSTTLTLTDGAAAATAIDLAAAAYSTVGEVADYINALASWECKVLDALRADASDNMWANGAITAAEKNGELVFDVLQDTSAIAEYKVRIAFDERVTTSRPKGSHRVTLNSFSYLANLTAAADSVRIYDCELDGSRTEEKIWSAATDDNALTIYSPDVSGTRIYPFGGITAPEGHELVLVITGTVIDASGTGFLQACFTRE